VVDAVEALHHHALHPQVVAPDPLDKLGVVDALDQDPAGPGPPGPETGGEGEGRGGNRSGR